MPKRTKIVATLAGDKCTPEFVARLVAAGMDVVRLNTAHMTVEEASQAIAVIHKTAPEIAVMVDTKGPEVRVADLAEPLELAAGDEIKIYSTPTAEKRTFQVNYSRFVKEISAGQHLMLDDGEIELEVTEKTAACLTAKAINPGTIYNHKSVNAPGAKLSLPSVSRRDREFIEMAIESGVDFIAHSFVRGHNDVMAVQSILDTSDSPIKIIAKIENRQGVDNLGEILDCAYGVMVARGDLGVEVPLEDVPKFQKKIIYECMRRRKAVITATQMLQSMMNCPRPTRAEVSDVANAVLDGTDAVMLSGETSIGKYPEQAVATMRRIIVETEKMPRHMFIRAKDFTPAADPLRDYLRRLAQEAVSELPIKAIVCHSDSGAAGLISAAYRGEVPVYIFSPNWDAVRRLGLSYGVRAGHMEDCQDPREQIEKTLAALKRDKWLAAGDMVAYVGRFDAIKGNLDILSILTA